jgi:hypothetical protein
MFSEESVEEHGYASLQTSWFGSKLDDSLPGGPKSFHTNQSEDDQGGHLTGAMALLEVNSKHDWRWWKDGQNSRIPQAVPADAF